MVGNRLIKPIEVSVDWEIINKHPLFVFLIRSVGLIHECELDSLGQIC